ncbi:MAG: hypothetical protein HQK53_16360 [Oligoflexia bacterium]|nr:hypothetical protein [Oligoflexia bacterium]
MRCIRYKKYIKYTNFFLRLLFLNSMSFSIMVLIESDIVLADSNSFYFDGLSASSEGRFDQAYLLFDKVTGNDPTFVLALLETQKIHYRKQEWDKFFGYAQYYRNKLLKTQGNLDLSHLYIEEMFSLEVLALLKFCYVDEAENVIQEGFNLAQKFSISNLEFLERARYFIFFTRQQIKLKNVKQTIVNPSSVFKKRIYWPATDFTLKHVSHPRDVRVEIKDQCI